MIAYRDLVGEPVEPTSMNGKARKWAIPFMTGEPAALTRPPYVDAVFARDDLRPGLVYAARLARGAFR